MSRQTIDERVVKMEFDNTNFEKNVAQSLGTIEKLSAAISTKLDTTNFNLVSMAAEAAGSGFSKLEQIGIGALRNLGGAVQNWAVKTVKDMTGFNNAVAGFTKFNDINKSTGVMISQGFEMDEIETQLDRLSWFSDETSYSLSDMTDNIAKFTATGEGLKESADAIEGIALWAALSGQNASTATRAMYQLSQAMGSGVMRKEDWKSIQNMNMDTDEFRQKALDAAVAIGTLQKTEDGLYISTVNADGAFSKAQFADHLTKDAWFTKDVMMDVYNQYSSAVEKIYAYTQEHGVTASIAIRELEGELDGFGLKAFEAAQEARSWSDAVEATKDAASSGWASVFKLIIGNYQEATKLFTDLAESFYNILVEPINGIVDVLFNWHEQGGRDNLIEGVMNLLKALENVINVVKKAFSDIFPGPTVNQLLVFSRKFRLFTGEIRTSSVYMKGFENLVRGVFSVINIAFQVVTSLVRAIIPVLKPIGEIAVVLFDIVGAIFGLSEGVASFGKESDIFYTIFTYALWPIKTVLEFIAGLVKQIGSWVKKINWDPVIGKFTEWGKQAKKAFGDLEGTVRDLFIQLTGKTPEEVWTNIQNEVEGAKKAVEDFFNKIDWDALGGTIWSKLTRSWEVIKNFFSDLFSKDMFMVSYWEGGGGLSGIFEVLFDKVADLVRALFDLFGIWTDLDVDETKENVVTWIQKARDVVVDLTYSLQEAFGKLKAWFKGSGEEAENAEKKFEWTKKLGDILQKVWEIIQKVISVISNFFETVWEKASPYFDKIKEGIQNLDFTQITNALKGAGAAIGGIGLFVVLKKIWDWVAGPKSLTERLGSFVDSLSGPLDGLTNVLNGFALDLAAEDLKKAAIAIGILAASLFVLSQIDPHQLGLAAGVIAYLIAEIAAAIILINKFKKTTDKAQESVLSIKEALSGGITKVFDSISSSISAIPSAISKSIGEVTKTWKRNKTISTIATSLIKIALAVLILAAALKVMASIPAEDLKRSLQALLYLMGGLLVMSLALAAVGDNANPKAISAIGTSLIKISAAIIILVLALKMISEIDETSLKRSLLTLGALAGGILILILALQAGGDKLNAKAIKNIGFALIEISAAILVLVVALKMIAELNPTDLKRSIMALGAMMIALTAMILALQAGDKNIGVSVGLAFIGIATSMLILCSVAERLAKLNKKELVKGLGGIAVIITALTASLKILAKADTIKTSTGILIFAAAMLVLAGVVKIFAGIEFKALAAAVGAFVVILAAFTIAAAVLSKTKATATLAALAVTFVSFGAGVALTGLGLILIGEGLVALAAGITAIAAVIGLLVYGIIKGASLLLDGLLTLIPKIVFFGAELIKGFIRGITENIGEIVGLGFELIQTLLDSLLQEDRLKNLTDSGMKVINAFLEGIAANIQDTTDAVIDIILGILRGVEENLDEIVDEGASFIITFLNSVATALDNHWEELMSAVNRIVTSIIRAIVLTLSLGEVDLYEESKTIAEEGIFGGLKDWLREHLSNLGEWAASIIETIKQKFEDLKDSVKTKAKELGENIVKGLKEGVKSLAVSPISAFVNTVDGMFKGGAAVSGTFSPSRRAIKLAKYIVMGLAIGVEKNGYRAINATEVLVDNVCRGFTAVAEHVNQMLDGTLDSDPVIRPILDLTDLENGVSKANGLFNNNRPMFSGTVTRNLNAISDTQTMPEGTNAPTTGTINFTQNNYSPKALSSVEIYRQTRNQLSVMKGRVGAR